MSGNSLPPQGTINNGLVERAPQPCPTQHPITEDYPDTFLVQDDYLPGAASTTRQSLIEDLPSCEEEEPTVEDYLLYAPLPRPRSVSHWKQLASDKVVCSAHGAGFVKQPRKKKKVFKMPTIEEVTSCSETQQKGAEVLEMTQPHIKVFTEISGDHVSLKLHCFDKLAHTIRTSDKCEILPPTGS